MCWAPDVLFPTSKPERLCIIWNVCSTGSFIHGNFLWQYEGLNKKACQLKRSDLFQALGLGKSKLYGVFLVLWFRWQSSPEALNFGILTNAPHLQSIATSPMCFKTQRGELSWIHANYVGTHSRKETLCFCSRHMHRMQWVLFIINFITQLASPIKGGMFSECCMFDRCNIMSSNFYRWDCTTTGRRTPHEMYALTGSLSFHDRVSRSISLTHWTVSQRNETWNRILQDGEIRQRDAIVQKLHFSMPICIKGKRKHESI